MDPNSNAEIRAGGTRSGENTLRIASEILICLIVIFIFDVSTPLGLAVWILYFIPLFLTLYLEWRQGPAVVTGIIIVLISASFFLSPQDIPPLYALLNRLFFGCLLAASAFLILNYKQSGENLKKSEENYRILTEWLPDAVIVYRDGAVRYANLVSLRLFAAEEETVVGRDILDKVQPAQRELVRERIRQAAMGAHVAVPDVHFSRPDGSDIRLDLALREIIWDGAPAVLILSRIIAQA